MNEQLFPLALAQCRLALANITDKTRAPLTREQIEEEVDEILGMRRFRDAVDRDSLIRELEEVFTIWSDAPASLSSDENHEPWLKQKSVDINWNFWDRYKLYLLMKQQLSPSAMTNIEKVTDDVLSRLEDPARNGPWDRRGLVMGDVQSGKTGTYIGLICKAADAGYKVIVVLAGMHNNLRSQTQIRLDEGFLGYKAVPPTADGSAFEATGVAEFGQGLGCRADSVTNRNNNGDFNRAIAGHFSIHPGGNPLLFVVKKNVSVLENLLRYIRSKADNTDPETKRQYHQNTPLLIIDDEADQASVDTKQLTFDENGVPDPEHDPTKINQLIRKLLHAFNKAAYVGFTATPFANIFIHEKARTKELGEDLFPKSFIINLPAPSNYMGAARVFGIREGSDAGLKPIAALPIIRHVSDYAASLEPDETEGWMPPRLVHKTAHVPRWNNQKVVPPSLETAIRAYLLAATIRTVREPQPLFNSMLVHVVRFTNVQNLVKEQVEKVVRDITSRLQFGDGDRSPTILEELRQLWETDFVPTTAAIGTPYVMPEWDEIAKQLPRIAASVEIKAINGSAADALEYENHKATGLNVIAVGADKLSRGLTLDGLVVSYFLRASRMYDTLMQMGRWFGYREKYLDVCRLYLTEELDDWFQVIASATEELRLEFEYMVSVGATPRQYGLKVMSHPALMVTSAAKMRTGTEMRLSFSGDISETILFDKGADVVSKNYEAVRSLIQQLSAASGPRGDFKGGYFWEKVNADLILDFLDDYLSHPDARRVNTKLLSRYIRKQLERDELIKWGVKLVSSSDAEPEAIYEDLGLGIRIGAVTRTPYPAVQHKDRYSIRRLVNPADEAEDLEADELKEALAESRTLWQQSTRKDKPAEQPDKPSGKGIRVARPKTRGLLLIYLLDPKQAELSRKEPISAISISFPESDTAVPISYVVTNLFAQTGDYDSF